MQPQDCARWHSEVVQAQLPEGETALLSLASKQYFTLNQTGSFIWTRLGRQLTLAQIATELESTYEISPGDALRCVLDFITELEKARLVVPWQEN